MSTLSYWMDSEDTNGVDLSLKLGFLVQHFKLFSF